MARRVVTGNCSTDYSRSCTLGARSSSYTHEIRSTAEESRSHEPHIQTLTEQQGGGSHPQRSLPRSAARSRLPEPRICRRGADRQDVLRAGRAARRRACGRARPCRTRWRRWSPGRRPPSRQHVPHLRARGHARAQRDAERAVATVDLGVGFLQGTATDTTLARLDQVVSTVTAVPGVTSVLLLINGGTPLGLFPGVDATVPLTRASLATPNVPAPTPPATPAGPAVDARRRWRSSSSSPTLGYLQPEASTAWPARRRTTAVMAFQKWQGLPRTGVADATTLAALATAERPDADQAGPAPDGGSRSCSTASSCSRSRTTRSSARSTSRRASPRRRRRSARSRSTAKFPRWWSVPFREWLLWASPFTGGIAMHQYPDVPPYRRLARLRAHDPVRRALALRLRLRRHARPRDRELPMRRASSAALVAARARRARLRPRSPTRRRRSSRASSPSASTCRARASRSARSGPRRRRSRAGFEIDLAHALAARLGIPRSSSTRRASSSADIPFLLGPPPC